MSIRSRLLLLVLLITLLPTSLVGLRFVVDRARQIDAAVGDLSAIAEQLADALQERILGTVQLQYGLARARDLDTDDRAACSAFLSAVREAYPQYTGILTIDPNGRLFCDSLSTGRELDLRDRGYFKQASIAAGGVALEPAFGRLTGISVLQIAHPVRALSGQLRFILLASLNLERFIQDRAGRDVDILLMDRAGTVMVWSSPESRGRPAGAEIAGTPLFAFARDRLAGGAGEVTGVDGRRQVWAVAASRAAANAGLIVMVGQPKDGLVEAANRRLAEEMGVLAMVAAILFLGVWLLVEWGIRRQVARIGTMARRLGAGDLQARIAEPHPRGELGGLMAILNGTAASLERQHAAIEELNQKLRQSQKMEAVGQLTGGVAHDFNNLLTVIIGNAEVLAIELARQPDLRKLAEMTLVAAERGADLTRSLLAFARRQALEPRALDVNGQIQKMEPLLRRTLGEHIEYRFVLGGDIDAAMADPAQLESALLNLALNARDAMPDGGRLTIETATVFLDEAYAARNDDLRAGAYVLVAVGDSGTGMAPEIAARAFEPFFTTKEVGKGTGLGLSMVYGFAKQSGGHIKIYSEPGHGTVVKLYLPRAAEARAETAPPVLPQAGRGETILAVEDDDLVRAHVVRELKALGYLVLEARNGAEALEVLRAGGPVDLLFSDVVMPGLSGPALAAQAARLRPGLKVLFTSGYTENTVIHHGRLDPGMQLLNKPYRRQDLAQKVREVLSAP